MIKVQTRVENNIYSLNYRGSALITLSGVKPLLASVPNSDICNDAIFPRGWTYAPHCRI